MESPPTKRPKCGTISEHPSQIKKCSQGKGDKVKENGVQKKVVPETAIKVDASPVNWEPVDQLQPSPYIDYKVVIVNERTPDLFPPALGTMNVSKQHSLP